MCPPIAVLGAGPAGLMLGRLLELSNIPYTIFERDASPSRAWGRGGSGTLDIHTTSGQLALREARLLEAFKARARWNVSTVIADAGGKVWARLSGEGEEDRPEIDRRDLRVLLLESVPQERVKWGCWVESVGREGDGSMGVRFAGGGGEGGFRLVVGADGAWSRARSLITSARPKYFGMHALTTNISPASPFHPEVARLAGKGNYVALSEGKMISAMKLGDDSYYVACGLKLSEGWSKEHAAMLNDPAALRQLLVREHFADWSQMHRGIVEGSDSDFYIWPLYGVPAESIPWKSVPGVTLVGDAAHLTPPSGEGVNMAMYDSLQLAQSIVAHGVEDLDGAVEEYERLMIPRALETIADAKEMVEGMYGPDTPRGWLRGLGVPVDE